MSKNFDSIIESVEKMSVLDLAELVKALEVKFGVSAAAMSAPSAAVAGESAEAAAPAQEKSEFKVILKDFGADKIAVIKAVRQVVTMGLGEAKKLVESAPVTILEAASKDDSKKAKELLEGAGAKVELA
ncbi:MAG TPA: 50S ribosomal protein L7/L12 [Candidatus Saccharimonadales bacterium]|nr:50S ribosomal protein L7/L12 [Candidatus Saccharimonadales bacterium]